MWLWRNGFTTRVVPSDKLEVVESEAAGKLWSIVERAWVGSPLPEDKKEVSAGWRREGGLWLVSLLCGPEPIDRCCRFLCEDPRLSRWWVGVRSLYYTSQAKMLPGLLSPASPFAFCPGTLFQPREGPSGELLSLSLSCVLVLPGRTACFTTLAYQHQLSRFTLNYSQNILFYNVVTWSSIWSTRISKHSKKKYSTLITEIAKIYFIPSKTCTSRGHVIKQFKLHFIQNTLCQDAKPWASK